MRKIHLSDIELLQARYVLKAERLAGNKYTRRHILMSKIENDDTRYFIEIDLGSLEIIRVGFDQKQNLDKGQQKQDGIHRLFLTKGQYNKFVSRCESELQGVLDA